MDNRVFKSYNDYVKSLYGKALVILKSEKCDDSDVIAGGILLIVGLEKLVKEAIHSVNPLMTLQKPPRFDELLEYEKGGDFRSYSTISFEAAVDRIVALYPDLKPHQTDIKAIIKFRNILVHNFGDIDIGSLERRLQIKVADFTEDICNHCFEKTPDIVLGKGIWAALKANRDIYKNVESLELNNRIEFLRKRFAQGQPLGCPKLPTMPHFPEVRDVFCPVCEEGNANIVFDIDGEAEVCDGRLYGTTPTIIYMGMYCLCGFSLDDEEEITLLVEENDEIENQVEEQFSNELDRLWSKML